MTVTPSLTREGSNRPPDADGDGDGGEIGDGDGPSPLDVAVGGDATPELDDVADPVGTLEPQAATPMIRTVARSHERR